MCGIVGIVGNKPVTQRLVDGLKRLEYRGYDSAGVAVLADGRIERRRAPGKLGELVNLVSRQPLEGTTGIAHTRWATHGIPNEVNAHPHINDKIALVHNGIIENHMALREELTALGYQFASQTDTEVALHLLDHYLKQGLEPVQAAMKMIRRLHGAFALGIIFPGHPQLLIGARQGAPLAIGHGEGEMYLGSDALAVAPLSPRITYLEDGDIVVLTPTSVQIFDINNQPAQRPIYQSKINTDQLGKDNHQHFMLKEIFEQPKVVMDTIKSLVDLEKLVLTLPALPWDWTKISRLTIVACGTSYYAGLVAKNWFETWARIPVEVDIASEFRYRQPPLPAGGVALFISQSGETADTMAAAQYAKSQGQLVAAIVNVPESSLMRLADMSFQTLAGVEIGVASTKAFSTQLAVLACLALAATQARGARPANEITEILKALAEVSTTIHHALQQDTTIESFAASLAKARDVLYLGRGLSYALALEGALKLKEISYIHAEGYAAGEMKHGPIALIDDQVPVIVVAPSDAVLEKTLSNVEESRVRGGKVVLISDANGLESLGKDKVWHHIPMPPVHPFVAPLVYTIPLQLLAYFTALAKGTDIDQPRNLAKSVTVE